MSNDNHPAREAARIAESAEEMGRMFAGRDGQGNGQASGHTPPTPGPLVRLETGAWIDPRHVMRIRGFPHGENESAVVVTMADGRTHGWYVNESDPAKAADDFAARINAARRGGGEDGR